MKSLFFICILFRKFYKNKKYWIVKTYSISYEESIYWLWKLRIAYFGKSIWLVFIIFWWSLCCENKTFYIYQPFLKSPNKRPAKNYCAYLKNHEMFKDPGLKTFVPIEHCTIEPIFSKTLDLQRTTFSNEQEHILLFFLTFWVNAFMEIFNPTGSCYKTLDKNETDMQILCQEFN